MKKFVFIFLCIWLGGIVNAASAQVLTIENAAQTPEWLALVHYRPKMFGGVWGTIDSESFYLAHDGRSNPQSELEASVALFEKGENTEKICLFPSRYLFLKKIGLVQKSYPKCSEYEKFVEDLQPQGVTLLFTDAYMNNPSSLFGHTLIRIDTARKGTQLLAHGLNYGAFTGPNPGPLYALLGLTGGYMGGFTVKPYYDIINTYNNIENRDIWEFSLNLSDDEKKMFVAHIWEVGNTQTKYYFFSQNCSYMLMEVLDAVRPSLKLADEFSVQAIPLDTIKAVYRKSGLVKDVKYRPSRQRKILHQYEEMNDKQRQVFVEAVLTQNYDFSQLQKSEQAGAVEAVYQYVQYQYVAKDLALEDYRRQSFDLLRARSQIKREANFSELTKGENPVESHESKRLVAGGGVRNGEGFQQISLRPAYHSLTDNPYGLLGGAEINFLNLTMRHYDNSHKYLLQDFDILNIKSISPINTMFRPVSYDIALGINREINPETGGEGYVFNTQVGGGGAVEPWQNVYLFALTNIHAAYGGFLPRNQYFGLGIKGGVFTRFQKIRLLADVEQVFATSDFGDRVIYHAEAAYTLSTNQALALEYKYQQNNGKFDIDETLASVRFYF